MRKKSMKEKAPQTSVQGAPFASKNLFLLLDFVNRNLLAVTTHALEANDAGNLCKKSIVLADADIRARMDVSAALTNENVASRYNLTVCTLDAEALGLGITTVLGRTYALFMSEKL